MVGACIAGLGLGNLGSPFIYKAKLCVFWLKVAGSNRKQQLRRSKGDQHQSYYSKPDLRSRDFEIVIFLHGFHVFSH